MAIENTDKHVAVLGINHTSSSTELRDTLLFTGPRLDKGLAELRSMPAIKESVILSTCNRVELYTVVTDPVEAHKELIGFLSRFHAIPEAEFGHMLYFYHCQPAVEHLFEVVSSLDSMIVGEPQILGQVKDAFRNAQDTGNTKTVLNKLFNIAIEIGKRVRTETKIGEGAVSVSYAAIELAQKVLGRLVNRTAMIIGSGEMSKLTARHLKSSGVTRLYFANRTPDRARELASQFNGTALELNKRVEVMPECDIIISSTGSPHYIIKADEVAQVMKSRNNSPLFLIDIAAPRDIHPEVGKLYNVFLFTIDDLSGIAQSNAASRTEEIGNARAILKAEANKYFDWYNSLKIQPTLVSLRRQFEAVCASELKRYSPDIDRLPEEARELIREFAQSLTNKFLHTPSAMLKKKTAMNEGTIFADTLAELFDLKRNNEKE
jgi:glutamyl-tRNA reductase